MFSTKFTKILIRPKLCTKTPIRKCIAVASETVSKNDKAVAYWLLGMSGLVAGMVTVGGITRLTKSGLSMTSWKLLGTFPPITTEQWNIEFERYKTYPEWQQRQNMSLNEFKFIYFWEYGHRMMGRFLGVAFAVPFAYFSYKKMIPRMLYPRLGALFALGGTQGLIGWWMVKSGLNVDPKQRKEIRVSPYRLATHLGMAFTTYTLLLWTACDILNPRQMMEKFVKSGYPQHLIRQVRSLRSHALANMVLVATTVISGAYVAGNDAGRAYGTFPLMDGQWIPEGILELTPLWRNFVENTATVQFDHRILAMTTLTSIAAMYGRVSITPLGRQIWAHLPCISKMGLHATMGMSVIQVTLGITTLLLCVPIPLAAAHQAGSLVLLTCVTVLCHSLRFSRFIPLVTSTTTTTTTTAATVGSTGVGMTGMAMSSIIGPSASSVLRRHMSSVTR